MLRQTSARVSPAEHARGKDSEEREKRRREEGGSSMRRGACEESSREQQAMHNRVRARSGAGRATLRTGRAVLKCNVDGVELAPGF
eukprot:885676-Rhodomonas_salina.2